MVENSMIENKAPVRDEEKQESKIHWADAVAKEVIEHRPGQDLITVAAGITPSGVVHIGNFREIITVDLVAKAIARAGKKVRFIYSWDDYDVFRKVPANFPKKDMLENYLRQPIVDVPDPFDCHNSYAVHNEKMVENSLPKLGVSPEFLYQSKKYRTCEYAEGMKKALLNKDAIKKVLDDWRAEDLEGEWNPVRVFCEKCNTDKTTITNYDGNYSLSYSCECGFRDTFDFRKKGIGKLQWRVDWPMRWDFERVDFEPSGKEHSSEGGSNTTAEIIVKDIFGRNPPEHIMYEFISIKGQGGKMSSSKGNTIDLKEMLGVYAPQIVRYIFVSKRPEKYFEVSFEGMDVIRLYSEFAKVERIYFGKETCEEKDLELNKRIYELSCVNIPKEFPEQIDFRHLVTVSQVYQFDKKKIFEYFNSKDENYVSEMVDRVKYWLDNYAEDNFKFVLQSMASDEAKEQLNQKQKDAINLVATEILGKNEADLIELFGVVCKKTGLDTKEFFSAFYKILIDKNFGPKLSSFVLVVGLEKVKSLLESINSPLSNTAKGKNSKGVILGKLNFEIDAKILEKFRALRLGIIVLSGVNNSKENSDVTSLLRGAEINLRERFVGVEVIDIPQIKVWREAYASFNGEPSKNKPSVDALVRRVLNKNSLPNINSLVDLYNYISIKYLLPVGGDDLDKVNGKVRLCYATGAEDFFMIGGKMKEHPNSGEIIYRDESDVLCRRWNWREADKTKFTEGTKNAVVYIESLSKDDSLEQAVKDFCELAKKYLDAKTDSIVL